MIYFISDFLYVSLKVCLMSFFCMFLPKMDVDLIIYKNIRYVEILLMLIHNTTLYRVIRIKKGTNLLYYLMVLITGKDALLLSKIVINNDINWLIINLEEISNKLCQLSSLSSGIILYFESIQIIIIYGIIYSLLYNNIIKRTDECYVYIININTLLIMMSNLKISNKFGYIIISNMNYYNMGYHSNGSLIVELIGLVLLCK